MSESTSDNTSNQSTSYSDSRMVLGENSAYTQDANKNNTIVDSGNTYIQTVDNGAVGLAFKGINDTVKEGFAFGRHALGFAEETVGDSLTFARQAQQDASRQVQASLDFAEEAQTRSFAQSSSALTTATNAMGQALDYGSKQTARALDSMTSAAQLVNTAYADAKGRGAMTDYLLMGAIVAVTFVAWRATRRA